MKPPHEPAPIDRYCRLFAPLDPPFDLAVMEKLGASMCGATRIADPGKGIPAGYTYFGQFIDHDLTFDQTPLPYATNFASIPSQTINASDGRLSLNQIYGLGPRSVRDGALYDPNDEASFRLGEICADNGQAFDLPMGQYGPMSAEDRNVENIILRQICVMFLKLHNLAVQELKPSLPPIERFNRARNRVCWQYHWLVRHDYLKRVLLDEVYEEVIQAGRHRVDWQSKGFSIPAEFSQAAFRFGHSMVRSEYQLNLPKRMLLKEIFANDRRFLALDKEMAIDWSRFLDDPNNIGSGLWAPANEIDTRLVSTLFQLPDEIVNHYSDVQTPVLPGSLALRTLYRGASTRLATGEQAAKWLDVPLLGEMNLSGVEDYWKELDEFGLAGRTPLWYYILLEAELQCRGLKLGSLGSQIVAEVIDGCLITDPSSYISCFGSEWVPPLWHTPTGLRPIHTLWDMAVVTGLAGNN